MRTYPSPETPETALVRLGAADQPWQPLPGGRSNRLWHVGRFVVKRYDAAAASPLFPNDPHAEALALSLFAPLKIAPTLRAAGEDWVIYEHREGSTWPLSAEPASIARLLYRLHSAPIPPQHFRTLPNGSSAILHHARTFGADCPIPPPPDPQIPPVPPRPVHADPVLGNILSTAEGPLLIDWQCPGMGDPAEDLATLLSPAMMWLYTGQTAPPGWDEALLSAYPDHRVANRTRTLLPVYRWRIMAHCAWKAARGSADYAKALQIERDAP